jgi:hypothetical protein
MQQGLSPSSTSTHTLSLFCIYRFSKLAIFRTRDCFICHCLSAEWNCSQCGAFWYRNTIPIDVAWLSAFGVSSLPSPDGILGSPHMVAKGDLQMADHRVTLWRLMIARALNHKATGYVSLLSSRHLAAGSTLPLPRGASASRVRLTSGKHSHAERLPER